MSATITTIDHMWRKKISDSDKYAPRFCTLFETYKNDSGHNIDTSRHLMALCLENLIDFVKWARESTTKINWISSTLFDNDYLRSEARNGMVMILIYTFSAVKAVSSETDMFTTLQDTETGLGINNKFSIRIYNDPYGYLSFLKTTISALIDAGVLPDNERQNQSKKGKIQARNHEEFQAFCQLQQLLNNLYDKGFRETARETIQHIIQLWQVRRKFVRNRRFVSAIQSLKQPREEGSPITPTNYNIISSLLHNHELPNGQLIGTNALSMSESYTNENMILNFLGNSGFNPNHDLDKLGTSVSGQFLSSDQFDVPFENPFEDGLDIENESSQSDSTTISKTSENNNNNIYGKKKNNINYFNMPESKRSKKIHETTQLDLGENPSFPYINQTNDQQISNNNKNNDPPIKAVRLIRKGFSTWESEKTLLYDIKSFISSLIINPNPSTVFLVDETKFKNLEDKLNTEETFKEGTSKKNTGEFRNLESIIRESSGLIASWPRSEYTQLECLIDSWRERNCSKTDLLHYWLTQCDNSAVTEGTGLILYEYSTSPNEVCVAGSIAIHMQPSVVLSLSSPVWRRVRPYEILPFQVQETQIEKSFGELLMEFFPFLQTLINTKNPDFSSIVVKYRQFNWDDKANNGGTSGLNEEKSAFNVNNVLPNSVREISKSLINKSSENEGIKEEYETIGLLSCSASKVLSRLQEGSCVHDLILEQI